MDKVNYSKGLEGVIVAESSICKIDGEKGSLYYRGYSIEDLADYSSFEEVTYLLLYGELPKKEEFDSFKEVMRSNRTLPPAVIEMIRHFPKNAHPMELLQSSIAYLSGHGTHKTAHSPLCNCRDTLHQISQLSSIVAAYYRISNNLEPVAPSMVLSHGANFLYMLRGEYPDPFEGRIMDKCLTLHAEHGMNASTFTARVVASTFSTCYCCISAAIGALYGFLHGGANQRVIEQLDEIGSVENVEDWVENMLNKKEKIMGMGHRVYKVLDPRAKIMKTFLVELSKRKNNSKYLNLLLEVERVVAQKMMEKGKDVWPNVDFFSGAVYSLLGIPKILFTPVFAMARGSGWLAHILEQRSDNRLYRPKSIYVGPEPRLYPKNIT